jgi:thymidylate kinase
LIVNLRGTHGSGKSTAVTKLMKAHHTELVVEVTTGKERPLVYKLVGTKLDGAPLGPTYIIGPYETACGGCDAIQPYANIWPLVEKYAKKGHVVFEGALVSSCVGSLGEAMAARRKKDCVVAYLDTPLQTCLDRIVKRRAKKGNTKPLNPKNTESKFKSVAATRTRFEELGVRTITINHKKAVAQLFEALYENSPS